MTFLELCQMLRQECSITGSGPSAVTSQAGILKSVVDWTNRAWVSIQRRHKTRWRWMNLPFSLSTTASSDTLAATLLDAGNPLGSWCLDTISCYELVADEQDLYYIPYPDFRSRFLLGTQITGRPLYFTEAPDRSLMLAPVPDGVYTIRGRYQKAIDMMAENADTPDMPSEFHELIVYQAMQFYGRQESAPEVYADGRTRYLEMMRALEGSQLPDDVIPGPLL